MIYGYEVAKSTQQVIDLDCYTHFFVTGTTFKLDGDGLNITDRSPEERHESIPDAWFGRFVDDASIPIGMLWRFGFVSHNPHQTRFGYGIDDLRIPKKLDLKGERRGATGRSGHEDAPFRLCGNFLQSPLCEPFAKGKRNGVIPKFHFNKV